MIRRKTDASVHDADLRTITRIVTRFYFRRVELLADNPTRSESRRGLQRVVQFLRWARDNDFNLTGQYWSDTIWAD